MRPVPVSCSRALALRLPLLPLPLLLLLALLLAQLPLSIAHGQSAPALDLQFTRLLPAANETKNPAIALSGSQVFIGAPNRRLDAAIWQANVLDAPFDLPASIGTAGGQPDYSPVSLAAAADGSVYAAFIDQENATLSLRRYADGVWGPTRLVMPPGAEFRVEMTLAVLDETIFVFWRSPDAPFSFSTSTDQGLTWSPRRFVHPAQTGFGALSFAAGSAGQAYVAYASGIGDYLQIVVARWDGTGFVEHTVMPRAGRNAAGPAIVVQADGNPLLAWREVEGGIFLAELIAGNWQTRQLIDMVGHGALALSSDAAGNIAAYWISDYSGSTELYAALKPHDADWINAARVGNDAMFLANVRADGLLHTVSEAFGGKLLTSRYVQFAAAGIAVDIQAQPLLDDGARVSAKSYLPLSFIDANSQIADFRWSWGDQSIAEAEWFPFSPDAGLTPPAAARTAATVCTLLTLQTQVRSPGGLVQQEPAGTSILLDRAVQTRVNLHNASSGEADASHLPVATLLIDNRVECSRTEELSLHFTPAAPPVLPTPLQLGPFAAGSLQAVEVQLPAVENVYTATIAIADEHGHRLSRDVRIDVDISPPTVVQSGTLSLEANPLVTLRPILHIHDLALRDWFADRDTEHAEQRIWGMQLRAQRLAPEPVGLFESVLILPFMPDEVVLDGDRQAEQVNLEREIPLERLLGSAVLPGDYQIQVQILDDAGNPAPPLAWLDLHLAEIVYPPLYLPLLRQ
jgi:hypothetical protein